VRNKAGIHGISLKLPSSRQIVKQMSVSSEA
jgi:hypothetical protein